MNVRPPPLGGSAGPEGAANAVAGGGDGADAAGEEPRDGGAHAASPRGPEPVELVGADGAEAAPAGALPAAPPTPVLAAVPQALRLEPRADGGVVNVHPASCMCCAFDDLDAAYAAAVAALDDGGGDGTWQGEPASPVWSPEPPSPLDRYGSGDGELFDLADEVEARAERGARANRPRRGQGGRSGVARADIPRKSKQGRNGGRVRARDLEKVRDRIDKFAARAPPRGGYWQDDGRRAEGFLERPAGAPPPPVTRWRIRRCEARERAAERAARQPHFPGVYHHDPAPPVNAGPVLSAEELGMDRETWELLLQLQHREINPNDYQVLLELDNTVEKPSLAKRKLRLFPTALVLSCADGKVTVVDDVGGEHAVTVDLCQVCQEAFSPDESVRKLPCGHLYHTECIDAWFEQSTKCPADQLEPETPIEPPVGFVFGVGGGAGVAAADAAAAADVDDAEPARTRSGAARLAAKAKEELGERLYPRVHERNALRAGKITGMLLEMDNRDIEALLADDAALDAKVAEALDVLAAHDAAAHEAAAPPRGGAAK